MATSLQEKWHQETVFPERHFLGQEKCQAEGVGLRSHLVREPAQREADPQAQGLSQSSDCQTQCTHHAIISVSQLNEVNPLSCQIRLGEMGIVLIDIQSSPTGWLAHFLVNWQKVTEDQWILNTVKGYQISFVVNPYQERKPHPSHFNLDQLGWWNMRLGNCVTKGR